MHTRRRCRFHHILALIFTALFFIWGGLGCAPKQPDRVSEADLALDMRLWQIFLDIRTIRRDVEAAFKDKKLNEAEVRP